MLRASFFENICGVAVYLGRISLQVLRGRVSPTYIYYVRNDVFRLFGPCSQNFILPCLEQALFDIEEFVVVRALQV